MRAEDVLPPKPGMFVLFGDVTVSVRFELDGAGLVWLGPPQVVDVLFHRSYVTRYDVTPSAAGAGWNVTLPSVNVVIAVVPLAPVARTV
jgi:hypothetical protein